MLVLEHVSKSFGAVRALDDATIELYAGEADGTVQEFALWNPANLGYLAAYAAVYLASHAITNAPGQKFVAGSLGKFTIGANHTVLLGPPFVFNKSNINKFNF